MKYDVIVIGAGAAGLMCAAQASYRGRQVLLIDKAHKAGKKILISGGGRCNFTNLHIDPTAYISNNPHFCKSALSRYNSSNNIFSTAPDFSSQNNCPNVFSCQCSPDFSKKAMKSH
jgi:predicted flavoprotein YhiN